ncbi:MAG: DUF945 family protein [Neisseriaceae bacterium]|nr:DUF945 family protein [Neisseriaceae bacterium]
MKKLMIILAILVVVGVVYSAFAFQLGQAFHQNATQEMQSLNLAFSQNLGQTNNADLFQIEQTDFKNNIFSSQAQYIVHLGGVETIKLNAKTKHGPIIGFQPMRYSTVYELEKDANTAAFFQAAGDQSPLKVTVKTGFSDNTNIRTEIMPLRFDKTASFIFSGLDSRIETNKEKSFIQGKWQSDGLKILGLGASFVINELKGTINLKENNGLYVGDNSYTIGNIKIDGGEVAKMMTANPTASIDSISYTSKSDKINGDYQTQMALTLNNAQVAGFHFGSLKGNIQLDKLPVDMLQQISQMRHRQLSQNEKEKLLIDVLKTNPVAKINLTWENNNQIATALFDLEAKMPKKSFKQAEPQDFLFKASVNIDIPKQMIHQAVSQSLMIANQSDAENQAQKWLNQMVANSNGLLVEDTQAYKSNIVFDNNKLVVNGVVQNFNDLGKPPALPEHKPTPNNPAQDL